MPVQLFVEAVCRLFDASPWIVATVARWGSRLTAEGKARPDVILREVTSVNRDGLAREIAPWLEEQPQKP